MNSRHAFRFLSITIVLLLGTLSLTGYIASMLGGDGSFPGVHPVAGISTPNVLGLDCAYGSNAEPPAAFPTSVTTSAPYSGPDFDGTLDSSCQATYLGDTDGVIHPLVEDNPTAIVAAGAGGGLTIDVVASLNSTTTINGFDISVKYDSDYVSAAIVNQ